MADVEGLWKCWCGAGEDWLSSWTGLTERQYFGRGGLRRLRCRPAEGRRGPAGTGAVAEQARRWLRAWRWLQHQAREAGRGHGHAAGTDRFWARLDSCLGSLGGVWEERRVAVRGAPAELLRDWAEEAEGSFRRVQAAESAGRRAAWRDWVLGAVKSRPGLLFKWVKGEASLPLVAVEEDGRWSLDPSKVVEREADKWKQLWLPEMQRRPAGPPLARLDGVELRSIARGLRQRVAPGADGWRALELRELPEVFYHRLAEFYGACEEAGRWPEPLRVAIVALLPRPIALLPLVYRIWAAARRPEVRAWVAGPGADGAELPGRGADEAAWALALEADCVGFEDGEDQDEALCGVFLDCSKGSLSGSLMREP